MIVATTGKFDVMHYGHFFLLHHMTTLAIETKSDMLILVDSDERIKRMTGLPPVFSHSERALQLKALLKGISKPGMSTIYVFDSDEELEDIYRLHSEVETEKVLLIKGSEWKDGIIIGRQYVDVFFLDSGSTKMSSTYIKQRISEWNEANQRPV
jgi:cytidyltransferase-like protein